MGAGCLYLLRTNANAALVQLHHPVRSISRLSNSCAQYVSRSASASRTRMGRSPRSSACSRRSPPATPRSPVTHIAVDCHCVRVQSGIGAVWRPLDEMLARPAFDGLQELRVRMCTTTTSAMERACFVEAFPRLVAAVGEPGWDEDCA